MGSHSVTSMPPGRSDRIRPICCDFLFTVITKKVLLEAAISYDMVVGLPAESGREWARIGCERGR